MFEGLVTWWFVNRLITLFFSTASECLEVCEEEFDHRPEAPAPAPEDDRSMPRG